MQMEYSRLPLSVFYVVLIAVMALFATGCNGSTDYSKSSSIKIEAGTQPEDSGLDGVKQLGEGKTKFIFTVTDTEGSETQFEIHTDEKTVGAALSGLGLIEGEESTYGLYVKTVNGITLDYDKDGKYWAFYINDEYAQTGVDSTPVTEGDSYSFRVKEE